MMGSKGNQFWIFIGRTDAEVEAQTLWPPDVMNWLIWKDPDAGKDWRQEDNRGWDGWMASLTQWTCLSNLLELVMDREAWHATVHEVAKSWTWLSDWIELCLIFSPDCPPTTDGDVYNEAKEALLNFTMYFILLISICKLIICTLNELKILNNTHSLPSFLYSFLYISQMQETFFRQYIPSTLSSLFSPAMTS